MESKGWFENYELQMGAGHVFEEEGQSMTVSNRDILTVIIDGKPNFYFIERLRN